jgi:hypothetical protein
LGRWPHFLASASEEHFAPLLMLQRASAPFTPDKESNKKVLIARLLSVGTIIIQRKGTL